MNKDIRECVVDLGTLPYGVKTGGPSRQIICKKHRAILRTMRIWNIPITIEEGNKTTEECEYCAILQLS